MRPMFILPATIAIGTVSNIATVKAETPMDIVAAQIRAQGYACDKPQSATRNVKASRPNETVWLLVCENASYRVTLVPDMAAKVETVKDQGNSNDGGGSDQNNTNQNN